MDSGALADNLFELGNFRIEAKKGTISSGEQITQVEPKVMQVLLVLCEHSNSVVEQEALFAQVWPNSVFSPNSLRRCIAELRKALNDDDKTLIKTHPKVGYSLNVEPKQTQATSKSDSKQDLKKRNAKGLSVAGLVIVSAALMIFNLIQNPSKSSSSPNIKAMQPITATDSLEDFTTLSPWESAIAFTREEAPNKRSIWIRSLKNEAEQRIEVQAKNIRNLTWASNENSIFYIEVAYGGWTIWQTLLSDDYQVTGHKKILSKSNSNWISNIEVDKAHLYFIAKEDGQLKLFQYSLNDNTQTILMTSSADFKPYDLTLNANINIAISGQNDQGFAAIKFFALQSAESGREITTLVFEQKQRFSIEALPKAGEYLLNNGRQLFHLNSQQELSALQFEHSQFIRFVVSAKKSRTLFLVSSQLDTDLHLQSQTSANIQNLVNSNGMDYFPTLSPDNKWISFYSTRYGVPQLFLHNVQTDKTHKVFENLDGHLFVDRSVWNHSGEQLAFSVGYNIYIKNVENTAQNQIRKLDIQGNLITWLPDNKNVLIQQKVGDSFALNKFDLVSESHTAIAEYKKGHIFVSQDGQIYLVGTERVQILDEDGKWQLAEKFENNLARSIRHQHSLYLLFENNPAWQAWNEKEGLVPLQYSNKSETSVATISQDQTVAIMLSETRRSDIVKLAYE